VREILSLRLRGYSRREIEKRTGVKARTVSNWVRSFKMRVKEVGLMAAAKVYGVDSEVDELFDLALDLRKNEITVTDCATGLNVANVLTQFGVDMNVFEEFVRDVFLGSVEQGLTGIDVTSSLIEFVIIRRETGRTFSEITNSYRKLSEDIANLNNELAGVEEQLRISKEALQQELKEAKTTRQELESFKVTRSVLGSLGFVMDDYEKLGVLMVNIIERNYDAGQVLELFSKTSKLEERNKELQKSVMVLKEEEERLINETGSLGEILEERGGLVKSIRLLDRQQLRPEDIQVITETVVSLSARRGLSPKEAVESLTRELKEHYEPLLNLKDQVDRREARLKILVAKLEEAQTSLQTINKVYENRREELDELNHLYELGVTKEELHIWGSILRSINTDIHTFRRALAEIGGIQEYKEEKTTELKELERQVDRLKDIQKHLEDDLKILSSEIVREVEKNLTRTETIMDKFEEEFLSPKTGFKAQTTEIMNESMSNIRGILSTVSFNLKKDLGDLGGKLKEFEETVNETIMKVHDTGKLVGMYRNIEVIRKMITGEDVDRIELFVVMHAIIDAFETWVLKNIEPNLISPCTNFKSELTRRMKYV
jgi:transcriptional regulator with XRE-family HTH domain